MSPILTHEMAMRWADLDELGHVNNVVFLDYAMEARAAHVAQGALSDDPVVSLTVEFRRPLLLSRTPVRISTRASGDELVQDIAPVDAGSPYASVTTRPTSAEHTVDDRVGEVYPLRMRRSDLGAEGTATVVKVFEYAQEARIASMARFRAASGPRSFVVARVDLTLGESFGWRAEPYVARTVLTRVGRSSITLSTLFEDGTHGRADAVLVGFDLQTQRSRPLTDEERSILEGA